MAGSFDISHSISFRPTPLTQDPYPHSFTDGTSRPTSAGPDNRRSKQNVASKGVTTTSFELQELSQHQSDPITRRHGLATNDGEDDLEHEAGRAGFTRQSDPLHLSQKIKTSDEISTIRTSISRRNSMVGQLGLSKDASKARKIHDFYQDQNENIERLLKPVEEHRRQARAENDSTALQYKIAVHASFAANICLAIAQLYGAISSSSLSLFTTMADALFDPLSNLTLLLCHRAINKVNPRKFPQGKARIETAGNIAFCFLMCSVSFILIVVSAKEIADGSPTKTSQLHLPSVIVVGVAFLVKLALFLFCFSLRNRYSQINILWQDHRNDLLINGVGLCTSILGSKVAWYIDPLGAILLSILIAGFWLRTAWTEFELLIGISADTKTLQLLTYISMTHSTKIRALDTVRAWYSGPRLIVEVDVVMDAIASLKETHDVAEELQEKLESLPFVERAYCHVDYETSHAPEHFLKKEI